MTGLSESRNRRQHRAVVFQVVHLIKSSPFLFSQLEWGLHNPVNQDNVPPPKLPPYRNTILLRQRTDARLQTCTGLGLVSLHRILIHALRSREEAALLRRAPAHPTWKSTTRDPIDAATVHTWTGVTATGDPVDAATVHAGAWQSATRDSIDAAAVHTCAWE
jgi:hypothetical protein